MRNIQIFCDFDGTITKEDTLNKFLRLYADKEWLEIEEDWVNGKIGSKECTSRQMELVPYLSKEEIDNFIDSIEIDETFPEFLEYVRENRIGFCIVSDGFDLFINRILEKNNLTDIKVFSNHLRIEEGKYICEFPYSNPDCIAASGMCKCDIVKKYKNALTRVIYIGDGVSDYCASGSGDFVFAKGRLLEYCRKNKNALNGLIGFNNFEEIKKSINCSKGEEYARYKV